MSSLNIERRQRYSGQGRTYVKTKAKIPINFDLASLDLMCSFVLSENRNVKKGQYINLRNLIEMLDMEKYINDQEKYKRVLFIKKGLEARLLKGLINPVTIIKYINGGIMDDDIIDIHSFVSLSNSEIEWINETVSTSLSYSFIYMEADRAIELFTRFKASDYTTISTIVQEIELFIAEMNSKFRKAKVEKNTDRTFSLQDESFRAIISDVYDELNSKYRKLITGMQGFNQMIGGGFENTRVYLFVGLTGIGKSLSLLDFAYQIKKYNKGFRAKDPTKIPCIVYLTMENTVTESVQRLFQMAVGSDINMGDYTAEEVANMMQTTGELYLTNDSPIDIIIKYRPNRSEDTSYLYTMTEDLEDEGYEVICVIQDHVKRIRSVEYQPEVRFELGSVINEMKTFAQIKDIPVITVTHVNREGARIIDNSAVTSKTDLTRQLGKAFVGESMLMLDNVDFASILNVEYDNDGRKYLVLNGIKYRIKLERDYVCLPYVPDNTIKLIEDYYSPVPLFKTTLSDVHQMNKGNNNQLNRGYDPNSGQMTVIASSRFSSQPIPDLEDPDDKGKDEVELLEFVPKEALEIDIPEKHMADLYQPIIFFEEAS